MVTRNDPILASGADETRICHRRLLNAAAARQLMMHLLPQVVLGVGLIMGDGVLTPAVTVVSAVEGLQIATSGVTRVMIIGISCAIIAALFAVQKVRAQDACQVLASDRCIRPSIIS